MPIQVNASVPLYAYACKPEVMSGLSVVRLTTLSTAVVTVSKAIHNGLDLCISYSYTVVVRVTVALVIHALKRDTVTLC